MKAVIFEEYGEPEVLKTKDIAKPTIGSKDILVRVKVTAVTGVLWPRRGAYTTSVGGEGGRSG